MPTSVSVYVCMHLRVCVCVRAHMCKHVMCASACKSKRSTTHKRRYLKSGTEVLTTINNQVKVLQPQNKSRNYKISLNLLRQKKMLAFEKFSHKK